MRPVDDLNAGSQDPTDKPAEIRTQRDADSLTVTVCGEIDLSTADNLDGAIREAEDTEIGQIVVDLSDLRLPGLQRPERSLTGKRAEQRGRQPAQLRPVEARDRHEADRLDRNRRNVQELRLSAGSSQAVCRTEKPPTLHVRGLLPVLCRFGRKAAVLLCMESSTPPEDTAWAMSEENLDDRAPRLRRMGAWRLLGLRAVPSPLLR